MRVRTLIKVVAALLFAGVAAVAAVVLTVDPNDYKPEITRQVHRATGREVEVGGDIAWRFGMAPAFSVSDVRFANAPWGTRAAMVEAERFEIELALLPLLLREVRVERLVIDGADVLLETDTDGTPNWVLGTPRSPSTPGGGDVVLPDIGNIEIRNARVAFRDGRTEESLVLAVERALAQATPTGDRLRLDIAGAWNDIAFAGDGEIGAPRLLTAGPFPVSLNMAALGVSARIDGTIVAPLAASGLDIGIDLEAADLGELARAMDADLPASGPVKVLARVLGGPDRYALQDVALVVGGSELAGQAELDLAAPTPRIVAALTSRRLDLRELPLPVAYDAAASETTSSGRVFSDDPLPLDLLRAVNGKIVLDFDELITPRMTLGQVHVAALLDNGALAIEPYRAGIAGGRVEGSLSIDARPETPVVAFSTASRDLDVTTVLGEVAGAGLLEGRFNYDASLSGRGASVAQVMGSLTGYSRLLMGEGRARTEGLDVVVGGLSQAIGGLFSAQGDWTAVNCIASDFTINDGLAVAQVMLADAENVTVVGEGEVNLRTEELGLKFTPSPKSATINVSVPVWVRGTLAQPTFAPDQTAVARRLGGLLGVVVFPPAALLGLGEMGSDDNPCLALATGGGGAAGPADDANIIERAGEGAAGVVEGAGEGVRDAVEGVGRGLRNLFGD